MQVESLYKILIYINSQSKSLLLDPSALYMQVTLGSLPGILAKQGTLACYSGDSRGWYSSKRVISFGLMTGVPCSPCEAESIQCGVVSTQTDREEYRVSRRHAQVLYDDTERAITERRKSLLTHATNSWKCRVLLKILRSLVRALICPLWWIGEGVWPSQQMRK